MRSIVTARPKSISELADRLGRSYLEAHSDVQVLANHHILYFDTDGRTKQPVIPYNRIRVDIEVVRDSGTDSAHA